MGTKKKEALMQFNKETILSAAKQLFEQKGIKQTTVDDIAKEADYSKSTIYVYFKSKEEIYNCILCEYMTMLRDSFRTVQKEITDFEDCYYALCNVIVGFQRNYPTYYESLLGEINVSQDKMLESEITVQLYNVGEEINELIEILIKRGIEEGVIRADIDIIATIFYFWSTISGIVLLTGKKQKYLEKKLESPIDVFLIKSFENLLKSVRREIRK